jgi:hypothetical protein
MLGRNLLAEKKGRMINTWPCASRATLQKIASAARTTGGGELRFDLRLHRKHARVKLGFFDYRTENHHSRLIG